MSGRVCSTCGGSGVYRCDDGTYVDCICAGTPAASRAAAPPPPPEGLDALIAAVRRVADPNQNDYEDWKREQDQVSGDNDWQTWIDDLGREAIAIAQAMKDAIPLRASPCAPPEGIDDGLLPCPFCGSKAEVRTRPTLPTAPCVWIGCGKCDFYIDRWTREDAAAAWNRRTYTYAASVGADQPRGAPAPLAPEGKA